ncbi:TPA: hypothetical protein ACVTEY_000173 [Salmonella enterica subsp. enterica]
MATVKNKENSATVDAAQVIEPVEEMLVGCVVRSTLDHEAGLVRELLVQRYREFGTELFEERANELVDCVRRIFARLAAPLEEGKTTPDYQIDITTLGDADTVTINGDAQNAAALA